MDCEEENPIKESQDINQLLNSFSSLQTNEKDDLVIGFQNIANELSYTTARFFLEMNNWWVILTWPTGCSYEIPLFTFALLRVAHAKDLCVCVLLLITSLPFYIAFRNFLKFLTGIFSPF